MKPITAEIVSLKSEDRNGYYKKRKRIWFPISQIQIYNTFEELEMDRYDPYVFEQYMTVNVHKDLFYYINCPFHRIEFLNRLAVFLRIADKIEQKMLLAAIQYEPSYDYDIILDIIDNFDDYEFYDGILTPDDYKEYIIENLNSFDDLLYDLEKYVTNKYMNNRLSKERGKFTKYGYIYYKGGV